MRRRVIISIAVVILCVAVAWILFLAAWDWSLTTAQMTVFVNDIDEVDGAECVWPGSQHFHVTLPEVRAQFRIMVFDESEQVLAALIDAREAKELQTGSIQLRLVHKRADGNREEILLTPVRPSLTERSPDGSIWSWLQDFQISRDLKDLPEGSLSLQWSMDYRDANGDIKKMSITIPLRKEEITVPSSIVRLDVGPFQWRGGKRTRLFFVANDRRSIFGGLVTVRERAASPFPLPTSSVALQT